jgi:hypothetical protein
MSILIAAFGAIGTGAQITLAASYSVFANNTVPLNASASIEFQSDGDIITVGDLGSVDEGDWISPKASAPGSYEIRATLVSGDTPSGTLGSWLALTSNRTWTNNKPGAAPGVRSCQLTIEIRLGSTVLDTTTVDLYAEVS